MTSSFVTLLVLGSIVAASSFAAGLLPLSFSPSARRLHMLTTFGSGLLIGTGLVVILPEGVEAIHAAQKELGHSHEHVHNRNSDAMNHGRGQNHGSGHGAIGLALVLGFVSIYLIDVLPSLLQARKNANNARAMANGRRHLLADVSDEEDAIALPEPSSKSSPQQHTHTQSTTFGLILHSLADGIALGASKSTLSSATLGLVVFVAILLHKAPAAFGLTATLLQQGVSKRGARGYLLLFSLAAPVGAVVTFSAVKMLEVGGVGVGDGAGMWWTGVVLVASGGSFLYVAMQAMQAASSADSATGTDVSCMLAGILAPLLTQIEHSHAHGF
ncbi:Zinc/iron permease [Lojkania enalia]|uniref:Zinc/iron permease n=1 Tax=Lojkania enalia TaxID=147567 RepID=A0A9P4JZU9_9PLEO|nr:Zinc/iron permease [Didymosphaeria enalia]